MDIKNAGDVELTPIHVACKANNLNEVEILLSNGADINSRFSSGITPLHLAIKGNSHQLIALLLHKGADVNAKDDNYSTPLHIAAQVENIEIIKLLINYKADVNAENNECKTVLHMAVETANKDIIKFLLSNGADPNKSNNNIRKRKFSTVYENKPSDDRSYTVLNAATRKNLVEIVKLLINYGADVNAKDAFRRTPLFYAIANTNVAMFKLLLSYGADIKIDPDLLNVAVYTNCGEIVKIILDSGIDVNGADCYGRTAFPFVVMKEAQYFNPPIDFTNLSENHDVMRLEVAKQLLSRGINVNYRGNFGLTTLHWVAGKGYVKFVEALLEYNPDVNAQDQSHRTPLYLSKNEVISQMLLQNGADVNIANKRGDTPLHVAAKLGNVKMVETLLKFNPNVNAQDELHNTPLHLSMNEIISRMLLQNGANVNVVSKHGETPLHVAVQKGHVKIVEALLEFNPDVNAQDEEHRTALHLSTNVIISQMLLRNGADVNVANKCGYTPLHLAAEMGNTEIAEALLKYNPDVNAQDELHNTPLHLSKNEIISRMLLQNGADVNGASKCGKTPLHVAAQKGHVEIAKALLEFNAEVNALDGYQWAPLHLSTKEVISRMLLQNGANVNVTNKKSDTPLHVAAHRGFNEIAETLLEYNANIDSVNEKNATPLFLSVQYEKTAMSEMLLQRGAAVNAKCDDGRTPLFVATFRGHYRLVKLLLKYGADINSSDIGRQTPIYHATYPKKIDIFKMLLDHNPDINHVDHDKFGMLGWIQYVGQSATFCKLIIQHILKVKALDQYLSEKTLGSIDIDGIWERDFYNNCKEEVEKMKQHKISNTDVSPYDLLTKSVNRISTYITYTDNASDFEASLSTITEELFPHYYGMIVCKFEKVKDKAIFWNHGMKSLNFMLPQWLPIDVTEIVLSYLTDKDLKNLIEAYRKCTSSDTNA